MIHPLSKKRNLKICTIHGIHATKILSTWGRVDHCGIFGHNVLIKDSYDLKCGVLLLLGQQYVGIALRALWETRKKTISQTILIIYEEKRATFCVKLVFYVFLLSHEI